MKRGWLALGGSLGLSALWRRKRRDDRGADRDPAAELRAKLAESKNAPAVAEPAASVSIPDAPEPAAPPEAASPLDPDVRRRAVHERTRASMDELAADDD